MKTDTKTIYDQAALCETGCCPVVTQTPEGKIAISDPAFPNQGTFTFKDQAEADMFFAKAPTAYAAYRVKKP